MAFLDLSSLLYADKSHLTDDDLGRYMYASSDNTDDLITLGEITAKQFAIYNSTSFQDCFLDGGVSTFTYSLMGVLDKSGVVINGRASNERVLSTLAGNISFLLALEAKFNGGLDKNRLEKVVLDLLNERSEDSDAINKEAFDAFVSQLTKPDMLENINKSAFSDVFADNEQDDSSFVVTYNRDGNGECGLSSFKIARYLKLQGLDDTDNADGYAFRINVCESMLFMYALIRLAYDMYRDGRLEELFNMSNKEVFNKFCSSYLTPEAEEFDDSIDYDSFVSYSEWEFSDDISDIIDLFLGRGIEVIEVNLRGAQDEFGSESDDFSSILSNGSKLFFPEADEELLSLTYKIKCGGNSLIIFEDECELIDDKVSFHFDFSNMYKLLSRFYGNSKGNYFVEYKTGGAKCQVENPVFAFPTNAVHRLLGGSGYDELGKRYSINVSLKFNSQSL